MAEDRVTVGVDGRQLSLSNLGKQLYPDGTTKGGVIDYYTRIAPVLLPHLRGRPLTMKRYPHGSEGSFFYEKNAPRGRPEWVRTVTLAVPGSTKDRETIDYVVCDDLPTLVWCANLASLELHTPQYRVDAGGAAQPSDLLVLDLDPGPGAGIAECARVALALRDLLPPPLQGDARAKTSGSKGIQVVTSWDGTANGDSPTFAKALAEGLEASLPALVVSRMTKALRPGKVLVDWSQNARAKTTVSVYSLRARDRPWASAPVSWAEVEAAVGGAPLAFTSADVLDRVAADGDPFAHLADRG